MSPVSLMLGLDEAGAAAPLVDKEFDDCGRHCRMIDQGNNQCAGAGIQLLDSPGDGLTHLTFRIGVEGEGKAKSSEMFLDLFSTMADDDDDVLDLGRAQ